MILPVVPVNSLLVRVSTGCLLKAQTPHLLLLEAGSVDVMQPQTSSFSLGRFKK